MADRETIAAVLEDGFPGDLQGAGMDRLRELRLQCESVESELSYRRRVLHGHLDLLRAELDRRELSDDQGPVTSLLDSLGDGTQASVRSPSHQRIAVEFGEAEDDDEGRPISADLPDLSDEELRARAEAWVARERELSDQRRVVLGKLDLVQDEIVQRYKDGDASIDQILPSSP